MIICVITYSIYIQSLADFQPHDTYPVYDSVGGAQARLLLPKKQGPSTYNGETCSFTLEFRRHPLPRSSTSALRWSCIMVFHLDDATLCFHSGHRIAPAHLTSSSLHNIITLFCSASAVSDSSIWAEQPGGAGRWTLPDVNTGLDGMAEIYSQADKMANELTLYTTLQGITMQMLILRLIKVLSAQKRLSILTATAVKVGCSQCYQWQ